MVKAKYMKDRNFFSTLVPSNSSWGWKSIAKGRNIVELGAFWRVGNFWLDWWVNSWQLGIEMEIDVLDHLANAKVSDFITPTQSWDIDKLQTLLHGEKMDAIRAIPLPVNMETNDRLC